MGGSDPRSELAIRSCTVKAAMRFVRAHHRHLPEIQGGLFAARVVDELGRTRGVGIAGNPARVWQGTGRIVITRVATDGCPNACSALYGALARAAKALGYFEVWTYSLPEESRESLRGAGFEFVDVNEGGDHGRDARPRAPAVRPDPKLRWMRRQAPPPGADDGLGRDEDDEEPDTQMRLF